LEEKPAETSDEEAYNELQKEDEQHKQIIADLQARLQILESRADTPHCTPFMNE
jgi:hypothetical protein